ncbi:MAG: hypothetical protein P1U89_25840 [Verrucomicrobiales bacterium]|nr:hypothetical protein [Verrucomicrobiales bacterium]
MKYLILLSTVLIALTSCGEPPAASKKKSSSTATKQEAVHEPASQPKTAVLEFEFAQAESADPDQEIEKPEGPEIGRAPKIDAEEIIVRGNETIPEKWYLNTTEEVRKAIDNQEFCLKRTKEGTDQVGVYVNGKFVSWPGARALPFEKWRGANYFFIGVPTSVGF